MSSVSQLSQSHMTQDQGQRSLSIPIFVAILGAIVVIDNRLLSIRFRDQRRRNRQRNNFISTSIIVVVSAWFYFYRVPSVIGARPQIVQLLAAITEGTHLNDLGARLTSSRGIAFDMLRAREAHQWSSGYPGLYHEAPSLIDGSQTVRFVPVLQPAKCVQARLVN